MKIEQVKNEEEYNVHLVRLASACPVHKANLHCPLREVRKKSFSEKIQWVNSLSLKTKQSIYQYHVICFSKDHPRDGAALL